MNAQKISGKLKIAYYQQTTDNEDRPKAKLSGRALNNRLGLCSTSYDLDTVVLLHFESKTQALKAPIIIATSSLTIRLLTV